MQKFTFSMVKKGNKRIVMEMDGYGTALKGNKCNFQTVKTEW